LTPWTRWLWENEDFAAAVLESVKAYARTLFDETV
jgi:glucose-6-phosphate 1-dehydrogenase